MGHAEKALCQWQIALPTPSNKWDGPRREGSMSVTDRLIHAIEHLRSRGRFYMCTLLLMKVLFHADGATMVASACL